MAQPYSSQVKRDREAQKPFFLHSFTPSTHVPELPHARGPTGCLHPAVSETATPCPRVAHQQGMLNK